MTTNVVYQVFDECTDEVVYQSIYYKYCLNYLKEHFVKNKYLHIREVYI